MFGIGLPDLLFIGLLFLLLVKPAEWPRVARTAARTFSVLQKAISPVMQELRGVRDSLMAEGGRAFRESPPPPDWAPRPQSFQKGGEFAPTDPPSGPPSP